MTSAEKTAAVQMLMAKYDEAAATCRQMLAAIEENQRQCRRIAELLAEATEPEPDSADWWKNGVDGE